MPAPRPWLPWMAAVALGGLLGVGLYAFLYAHGASYLSNDPAACMNCHVMRDHFESWVKSSHHAAATCNDCHVPHRFPMKYVVKLENGWNHSRAFTMQDFREPIRIRRHNLAVLQQSCVECHQTLVEEITSDPGTGRGTTRCVECHRSVGHMRLD